MNNFVKEGKSIALTAPAAAVSGVPFIVGPAGFKLVGVPQVSVAINEKVECLIEGVVELPKQAADDFVEGEQVYWDDTNKRVEKTAAGMIPFAAAVETTVTNAVLVKVKLYGKPGVPV